MWKSGNRNNTFTTFLKMFKWKYHLSAQMMN